MKSVFVVHGETGEHADAHEWNVRAFSDEQSAIAFIAKANAWCVENNCDMTEERFCMLDERKVTPPDFDPNFKCDYTGVVYGYSEVPFQRLWV